MHDRRRRPLVGGMAVAALLLAVPTSASALPPVEELVVAPPGAEVVRARDLGMDVSAATASFLDAYEDLRVTTDALDRAVIRRDPSGPALLVTVVRLRSADDAAEARAAVATTTDTTVPAAVVAGEGVGTRRVEENGRFLLLEAYRVVGPDLVVWADLTGPEAGSPLLHDAVAAHLAAYPPTGDASPWRWLGIGAAVLGVAVVLRVLRRRGQEAGPASPAPGVRPPASSPGPARINW